MKHILVVEDDLPTLTLIKKILGTAGHRVTGVQEGMAALKAAQAETPDLVILDLLI
jgi:DNA-binding response OmpR family regulator